MLCSHCGEETLEWVTASGNGTVYSFTVIRQNGVPPFNERVPFVVATVDLDEAGARVIAAMPDRRSRRGAQSACACAPTFRPASDDLGFVDFAAGRRSVTQTVAHVARESGVGVDVCAFVAPGLTIDTTSLASTASTCSGVRGARRSRS